MKRVLLGLVLLFLWASSAEAVQLYRDATLDRNGNVVPGVTISVYIANTTTLATIYTDVLGAVVSPNPISSGSNGEFAFYAKDGEYGLTFTKTGYLFSPIVQVAIYDPLGENVKTVGFYNLTTDLCAAGIGAIDQIGATPLTLVINKPVTCSASKTLPATLALRFDGLGQITISSTQTLTIYDPGKISAPSTMALFAGAGTVAFTKGGQVWASWWGAKGDGATDSTTAIQSALTAAQAVAGAVILPDGTSMISAQLAITNTVTLRGSGWGSILKVDANATRFIPILVQGVAFAAVNGVVLRDFKLDGSLKGTLDAGLIQLNNAVGFKIDHLWVTGGGTPGESASQGVAGISVSAGALGQVGSQGTIENNLVEATTKAGLNWSTEAVNGLLIGNIVRNCTGNTQTPGIQVFGGYNVKVLGNSVYSNQGYGIFIGSSGTGGTLRNPRYTLIAENHVYSNGQGAVSGEGIMVANAEPGTSQFGRMVLSGNVVYSNGVGVNAAGIHLQNDNNILVEGNYVYLNSLSGINIEATQNVSVTNNVIESNNTANLANQAGVYLLAAASATLGSVSVTNNKMYNGGSQHQKYPIYYDNSAAQAVSDVVMRNNHASGHETSDGINFDYALPQRLDLRHLRTGQVTTDATVTNIFYATVRDNSSAVVSIRTVGLKSTGADRAMYSKAGLFYRNGGVATLQGALQTAYEVESNAAWDQTIGVDGANVVRGRITGVAATTITWDSLVEIQAE